MATLLSVQEMSAFRYQTCTGKNGETLYHAPIEIGGKADLDNYGITWNDCRTINFGGTDPRTVYFFKTTNREFAEFQWRYLNREHNAKVVAARCMIRGEKKAFIRCPTSNSCKRCPYGKSAADRKPNTISWDKMLEDAYETEDNDNAGGSATEEMGDFLLLLDSLRTAMDLEDERLMKVFEMKELDKIPVREIAEQMNCSQPRIYQLATRAKEIAREVLADKE